mgnify:CR=1 FL=1
MNLNEIQDFINNLEVEGPLQVDAATLVEDPKETLQSYLNYLRGDINNRIKKPYYSHAMKIINHIKQL